MKPGGSGAAVPALCPRCGLRPGQPARNRGVLMELRCQLSWSPHARPGVCRGTSLGWERFRVCPAKN